ncbi:MAG: hypothetical protein CVU39_22415 [Chloroflexi bacterium HGW-Chloroflexi-10]|nr:MAG: hypothetical protein CVU39_22415 [Chloroflexi bacterium HGW-Chloroflexi-10]
MITIDRKPRWSFYTGWIVLSTIAFPLAWVIAWAIISQVEKIVGDTIQVAGQRRITEDFLSGYVLIPTLGLLIGVGQYFFLRSYVPRLRWWIAATLLGCLLPFGVFHLLTLILAPIGDIGLLWRGIGMTMVGGLISLPQWLVLRRQVRHALWWIFAHGFGWGLFGLLTGTSISNTFGLIVMGLIPAIATSAACWLLLDWLPHKDMEGRAPVSLV